jgi:hypothetical protein
LRYSSFFFRQNSYDQYGEKGLEGNGGMPPGGHEDLFSQLFGGAGGGFFGGGGREFGVFFEGWPLGEDNGLTHTLAR